MKGVLWFVLLLFVVSVLLTGILALVLKIHYAGDVPKLATAVGGLLTITGFVLVRVLKSIGQQDSKTGMFTQRGRSERADCPVPSPLRPKAGNGNSRGPAQRRHR